MNSITIAKRIFAVAAFTLFTATSALAGKEIYLECDFDDGDCYSAVWFSDDTNQHDYSTDCGSGTFIYEVDQNWAHNTCF